MKNKSNSIKWNRDKKAYFFIYKDAPFLKSIYSQMFADFPDIGLVAYVGANTHRVSKDYLAEGENLGEKESGNKRLSKKHPDIELQNRSKNIDRQKAGLKVCDSKESSEIREYANIHEIKEMNNMSFYNQIIIRLIETSLSDNCTELCYIYDEIMLYEGYKEDGNVYIKMGDACVWLMAEHIVSNVESISKLIGKVHMIGYVLSPETENKPKIVKAISLFA